MPDVGRRRQSNHHLPPLMTERAGRYYYGRNQVALGPSFPAALRRYSELHGATLPTGTFADVAAEYLKAGCPRATGKAEPLAPSTLAQYEKHLPTLIKCFGRCRLGAIRPVEIRQYLNTRGNTIAGTLEKAILSAIFSYARNVGIYDGPNPCIGIVGATSRRKRYVTDEELSAVLAVADQPTRDFVELAYLTGQRPSDVLRMRRTDVQEGSLWVTQAKTGAKVRIAVVGPLDALLARLATYSVGSVYLVRDERGQRLTLQAMRRRFWKARELADANWQIRDLRAKAASDMATSKQAQALLGHTHSNMTDSYIRQRVGAAVQPVMRDIKK